MVMIENYLNGTIWKYFGKNTNVQRGLELLEIRSVRQHEMQM